MALDSHHPHPQLLHTNHPLHKLNHFPFLGPRPVIDQSINPKTTMSRNNGKGPKMDLKLNLSLSGMRGNTSQRVEDADGAEEHESPNNSSSPSSCVSSDAVNSPEATSMVLAGCPRCLMYVMLAEEDPKCPKCKSTVLLDFNNSNKGNTKKNKKS